MSGTTAPRPVSSEATGPDSDAGPRLRRGLAAGPVRLGVRSVVGILSLWRRSLQFRVVAVTMVLGTLVLAAVGSFLYQRVADGLVEERRLGASAEVVQLVAKAQLQLGVSNDQRDTTDGLVIAAKNTVQSIAGTEQSRYVVLARSNTNTVTDAILPPIVSGDEVGLISIPPELQQKVAESPDRQQTQIIEHPGVHGLGQGPYFLERDDCQIVNQRKLRQHGRVGAITHRRRRLQRERRQSLRRRVL